MKNINNYIFEKLHLNDKDIVKQDNFEFVNGFHRNDVVDILHDYGIKDSEYTIERNDKVLCIQFNEKTHKKDSIYIMSGLESYIDDKKLSRSLYITGNTMLNKPEIYINKY